VRKIFICFFSVIAVVVLKGQTIPGYILIKEKDTGVITNRQVLFNKKNSIECHLFNITKPDSEESFDNIWPLMVIKVFLNRNDSSFRIEEIPENTLKKYQITGVNAYLQKQMHILKSSMQINVQSFIGTGSASNKKLCPAVIYEINKKYYRYAGQTVMEIYNTYPYTQYCELQATATSLNINAIKSTPLIMKINDNTDSIRISIKKYYRDMSATQGKLYLYEKKGDSYLFGKKPHMCEDCIFGYDEELIYKSGIGIVGFTARLLGAGKTYIAPDSRIQNPDWFAGETEYYFKFSKE
jgi:hypothetical protein